jgi:rod shape determining protein RodA
MKHIFQLSESNDKELSFLAEKLYFFKNEFLKFDFLQFFSGICLAVFGILFIYSAGQQVGGSMVAAWEKQILWVIIGVGVWLCLSYANYRILGLISPLLYAFSLILLVLIFFIGVKIYGATRWLSLGGIRIQPSEFAKIATLLFVARLASLRLFKINNIFHLATLGGVVLLPFLLVLKQPDLGSSLVFPIIFAAIAFAARLSWKYIIIFILAIIIIVPVAYPFLKGYQKERILVFLNPDRDPQNQGWTSHQTILSVGSGGLYGKGLTNGTQNALGFLPRSVSNSDLIFSVIAEESGFLGSVALLFLYSLLLYTMLRTAYFARDKFGYLIAVGIAAMFFEHSFVNVGMNIRLMPITGLPLPLVSYGGSFMITSMICLGILQSIYIGRKKYDE